MKLNLIAVLLAAVLLSACSQATAGPSMSESSPPEPSSSSEPAEENPLVTFYFGVLQDLYETDPGLNDGVELLAFDLTEVQNLSEAEKSLLVERLGEALELETVQATYEELVEQGLISEDPTPHFETGLLFTAATEEEKEKEFSFSAQKWRSGLGAYFFSDCTASLSGGTWDYTIGAEMIS